MVEHREHLSSELMSRCWSTAKARDAIKPEHTDRRVSDRPGYEIHFDGLRVENAVAQFVGRPDLVDWSVQSHGDGGSDMLLFGKKVQIKGSTYEPPWLRFDIEGSQRFTADLAVLALLPRQENGACADWVDLYGWITRDEFFARATVKDLKHGKRLVVEPPLHPMSSLLMSVRKMMDTMELFTALCEPFSIEEISWRVGPTNERSRKESDPLRGQPLCYVDARTVMDRFDSVCGTDGWQCNYTPGVATSIVCNIGVRLAGDWIWKGDGAGATDMEADKGALSDAFKRAAVRWGVGRYLYDVKAPWLELEQRGKTSFIREADHAKLRTLHEDYARKAGWGDESGAMAYRLLLVDVKQMPPEARETFVNANMPLIDRMPVVMRRHLLQQARAAA